MNSFPAKIDFCWTDHVPDSYTPVLGTGHHHAIECPEFKAKNKNKISILIKRKGNFSMLN